MLYDGEAPHLMNHEGVRRVGVIAAIHLAEAQPNAREGFCFSWYESDRPNVCVRNTRSCDPENEKVSCRVARRMIRREINAQKCSIGFVDSGPVSTEYPIEAEDVLSISFMTSCTGCERPLATQSGKRHFRLFLKPAKKGESCGFSNAHAEQGEFPRQAYFIES